MPAYHKWDGPLDRPGVCVDTGEVDEVAVVLGMVVVPEVLERVEELFSHSTAFGEVRTNGPKLWLEIAGTDPERDSSP